VVAGEDDERVLRETEALELRDPVFDDNDVAGVAAIRDAGQA